VGLCSRFSLSKKQKKRHIKKITERETKYEKNSQKSGDDNSRNSGGVLSHMDNSNRS
jgi:hypothetical protein